MNQRAGPSRKSLKLVGRVLGDKFKLTACIGIGGSGAVYKADQIALGRTVAVKILNEELSADARMITRFRDEAMSASRLNHPELRLDHRLRPGQRRPALPRDGVRQGPDADPAAGQREPARRRPRRRHHDAVARRDRGSAPRRRRPRRSQGRQHHPRPAARRHRRRQDRRLRHRPPGHRRARDRGPLDQRHARVHGARGDQRRAAELRLGHLRGRHHPVRAARLQDAVLRGLDDRDPREPPEGDDPVAAVAPRDTCPRSSTRSSPRRSRSTRPIGSRSAEEMRAALGALHAARARSRSATSARRAAPSCPPSFKFCPECGAPRVRVSKTFEIPTLPTAARRAAAAVHRPARGARSACSRTCGGARARERRDRPRWSSASRAQAAARCCATPTASSATTAA